MRAPDVFWNSLIVEPPLPMIDPAAVAAIRIFSTMLSSSKSPCEDPPSCSSSEAIASVDKAWLGNETRNPTWRRVRESVRASKVGGASQAREREASANDYGEGA